MPDRVREAVFGLLGSRYDCPGMLPPLHVADAFAGGGSMGLEALSRGAASCCFFERDRLAREALQRNLEALGVGTEATVIARNAWNSAIIAPEGRPFDLLLLDPPYADTEDVSRKGLLKRYLERIAERADNRPVVVLHHRASVRVAVDPDESWRVLDRRIFGTNMITLFVR